MAAAPGGTQTLTVLDGTGTSRLLSEVLDAGNPTALARVTVAVQPPNWAVTNTATAAAQATIARAAGATGVAHVCTSITGQINGDATGNADVGTLNLRDGATGAGTVLWTAKLTLATGANAVGTPIALTGLNIVGSTATAMTLEFSAAGATHSLQTVSMTGYDVG